MRDFAFGGTRLRAKWPLPKARHTKRHAGKQRNRQTARKTHMHTSTRIHTHTLAAQEWPHLTFSQADFENFKQAEPDRQAGKRRYMHTHTHAHTHKS